MIVLVLNGGRLHAVLERLVAHWAALCATAALSWRHVNPNPWRPVRRAHHVALVSAAGMRSAAQVSSTMLR